MTKACKASSCSGTPARVEFTYDAEGHRTSIVETTAGGSPTVTTTTFHYRGDAVVQEVTGSVTRDFVVDDAGTIRKVTVSGGSDDGTYLVTWNGHGDAQALWQVESDGTLTLANSFTYSTWGEPTTSTHNSIGDLGFRYLYVGAFDVQWDDQFDLGLSYMHARHYSPKLGRFLQPDPARAEANPYGYAANNPVSRADPSGLATQAYASWSIRNPLRVRGRFFLALFIRARRVDVPLPGGWLKGDNRGYGYVKDDLSCRRSRACLIVDFNTNRVSARVAPSCGAWMLDPYRCSDALRINYGGNWISVNESVNGSIQITWKLLEGRLPIPRMFSIDGSLTLRPRGLSGSGIRISGDGCPRSELWYSNGSQRIGYALLGGDEPFELAPYFGDWSRSYAWPASRVFV
jgi:RHS repeat-associated protein